MREPALIFDFGNVVAFFDYMNAFERLGARMGVSGEVFRQRIYGGGFAGLLAQFESGRDGSRGIRDRDDRDLRPGPSLSRVC